MSPKVMESGEQLHEPSAIEPLGDAVERGLEAVLHGGHTLLRRRAWSKPAARIGRGGHEESNLARYNCAVVKRSMTRMALPQRGQYQRSQSGKGGGGSCSRPWAASRACARGSSRLRKRLASRP